MKVTKAGVTMKVMKQIANMKPYWCHAIKKVGEKEVINTNTDGARVQCLKTGVNSFSYALVILPAAVVNPETMKKKHSKTYPKEWY